MYVYIYTYIYQSRTQGLILHVYILSSSVTTSDRRGLSFRMTMSLLTAHRRTSRERAALNFQTRIVMISGF